MYKIPTRNSPNRERPAGLRSRGAGILIVGILMLACQPSTDATTYAPGDIGEAEFRNTWRNRILWFGGCNAFTQQSLEASRWIDRGGEVTCVWEGFADPLDPHSSRIDAFTAREAGTWRLNYDVGFGCSPDAPLSATDCLFFTQVTSNPFAVVEAVSDEMLCTETAGLWDPLSCGHYACGNFPDCDAVVPGCDCGAGSNFVEGIGCVEDASCSAGAQALCEETGGIWDPLSCGHYSCGQPPLCEALIPGCNCGPTSVFEEQIGCLAVPCGAPQE